GWEGSRCGPDVDVCWKAPAYESTAWVLWRPTPVGAYLEERGLHPFTHAAVTSGQHLSEEIHSLSRNGTREVVFAHLLRPHFPFLLDAQCVVKRGLSPDFFEEEPKSEDTLEGFLDQIKCAERIAKQVADA